MSGTGCILNLTRPRLKVGRVLVDFTPPLVAGSSAGEGDAKLAQKLGQLQPLFGCIRTPGMRGPASIFWALA